jgi:uncharacterized MAPEG superfamily protein
MGYTQEQLNSGARNPMPENYSFALWGVFVILVTVLVQALVAAATKASQPGAIPGKMDESLGHSSFVFRSNRTVMNSLENIPVMIGASFLALFAGADAFWTGTLIWVFAIARIAHMALYYAIATDRNPSPRSYFFLLGVAANIALLVFVGIALAG